MARLSHMSTNIEWLAINFNPIKVENDKHYTTCTHNLTIDQITRGTTNWSSQVNKTRQMKMAKLANPTVTGGGWVWMGESLDFETHAGWIINIGQMRVSMYLGCLTWARPWTPLPHIWRHSRGGWTRPRVAPSHSTCSRYDHVTL